MGIKLYLGNSIEFMRTIPDKSIDAVVTDFPYGNGTDYGDTYNDSQDNLKRLIALAMPEIQRVSRRALVFCGVDNVFLYPKPDWILSWHTPAGSGSSKWGFCCWQPMLVYGKDPYLQGGLGRRPDSIVWTETSEPNSHPCPKPVRFMKWAILRISTVEGDTILDPFMGSGTTGVACVELGRNFMGCEINPRHFGLAEERIEAAEMQPGLFQVNTRVVQAKLC